MKHEFKVEQDYYSLGKNIYTKSSVTIKEGLTILCGCNGSGKSTLLSQINKSLKENKIPCLYFDNRFEGGANSVSDAAAFGDIRFIARSFMSSEGELIIMNTTRLAQKIRSFIGENRQKKEIFLLLDGIDSGLSIDNIIDLKRNLLKPAIEDCKKNRIILYIIVAANVYELARNEQCLDVLNLEYATVNDYEEYRKIVVDSRKAKSTRYKAGEWTE